MNAYRFDERHSLERFRARRSRWLRRLNMLDRPWLILGAAPDPTLPKGILRTHARVDINNAGRTAATLGLGRADLTFRSSKKSWEEHAELDTRALIWLRDRPVRWLRLQLRDKPYRHIGRVSALLRHDRDEVVRIVAGTSLDGTGDFGKVTNGVAAACYGLFLGVPEIVLAGISLTKTGHSYDGLGRRRLQVEEDSFVLEALGADGRVATTEPELAAMTRIRLWEASAKPSLQT